MKRYCAYLRISTTDKQDESLSFPSQLRAIEAKATELGGSVVCQFEDQASGARDDRPGWGRLLAEAKNRADRRFDGVVLYSTSRLARDAVLAALYEKELRAVGVEVAYAVGGVDGSTPEGELMLRIFQGFDNYEREKLKRESLRGMRENAEQGFRNGGVAPYGFLLAREPHPNPARASRGETKSRLAPDPEQAPIVCDIFDLWAKGLGVTAIADRLNERGILSPSATNPRLNTRGDWAKSTINSILRNPAYVGKAVWDRIGNEDAWTVAENTHEAIISDEVFADAQERLQAKSKATGHPRKGQPVHLLSGMVRCASGHPPLSTYGNIAKHHVYYRCSYGVSYGKIAAAKIDGHGVSCNVRESLLLPFIERFFCERLFGPLRMDLLAEQLERTASAEPTSAEAKELRKQIAAADRDLAACRAALSAGIDADAVSARISQLEADRGAAQRSLAALPADASPHDDIASALERLPDLSDALRDATPEVRRLFFDAFDLRLIFDKIEGRIQISATITQAVADLLHDPGDLALCGGLLRGWDSNPQPFG